MEDNGLWKIFSEFIRLRDADENGYCRCFTCGLVRHWKQGDAGHGIPRQHKATKYDEVNNQFQCKRCNGFEGGMREVFKANLDKKYGAGTWDRLEVKSRTRFKMGSFEMLALKNYYKIKVDELKKQRA